MKLLLDNLFLLGQILSLGLLAWGGWLVLRESLAGIVFPAYESPTTDAAVIEHKQPAKRSVARPVIETKRAA